MIVGVRTIVDIIGASLSEPHTSGTSAARVCYIMSIVRQRGPGGPIRHVRRRGADGGYGLMDVVMRGGAGRPIAMYTTYFSLLLPTLLLRHGCYRIFAEQR